MGRFRRYSRDKISRSCLFAASNHIRGRYVPFDSLLTLTQLITVEEKSRNIRLMSVLLTDCDHDGMSTDWPDLIVRYSGKLSQEKTFANWWKYDFGGESFCKLVEIRFWRRKLLWIGGNTILAEKAFVDCSLVT